MTFTAPAHPSTLTFEMVVTGRSGDVAIDTVRVDVFADASSTVFVDPEARSASGDGTRDRPYRSIDAAVAASPPGTDLYLRSSGRSHDVGPIALTGGRSIFGGYDADWVRDPAVRATIEAADGLRLEGPGRATISSVNIVGGDSDDSSVAVQARGLDRLVIEGSRVTAGRSDAGSSIGVSAVDVATVSIIESTVQAGQSGDGAAGPAGSRPAPSRAPSSSSPTMPEAA